MNNKPQSVRGYLATLEGNPRADGYLCLNSHNQLITSGGWLGSTNLENLDYSQDPILLVPVLEGLLPYQKKLSTVINNAHVDNEYYFDIHLFHDFSGVWVVFIDKTQSGIRLQKEQQIRLDDDFANDKRGTGS